MTPIDKAEAHDDDLIRRGDALAAIQLGDTVTKMQARIRAIPYVDADPVCTGCGGTGVTYQTERRCACQGPDLTDPVTVHANMLRGTIAKPTVEQIIHLYGRGAFQPMIDASIAKALEKACLAVSEHADWPEDEHGRTEQVGLFARVINAIRGITPALSPALAPTDAAHVNETPKSEHDAGNVLTAAHAREAALKEAAEVAKSWYRQWAMYSDGNEPTRDDRAGGITYGRLQSAETIAAAILALIGKDRA